MEERIKLEILGLSSSQTDVGHFALVMEEADGNRRLPIIIDGYQARAIALEIENIKPTRPMTHDLIVAIAKSIGLELLEVLITELKDGIFFAKLIFENNGEIHEIDSRTSDAVAIGVRFKVPIYTFESVLAVAGIEVSDADLEEEEEIMGESLEEEYAELESVEDDPEGNSPAQIIGKLQNQILEAISKEDYERAAKLRDEITRLQNEGN